MKANHVTLDGPNGVALRQGPDSFVKGARLRMNMTTGEARVETAAGVDTNSSAPTPAQLSILAKPGVAPPAQPTGCPPGKMCLQVIPGQFNQANDNKAKGQAATPAATAPKTKSDAAQPQTSPSTVYRSN